MQNLPKRKQMRLREYDCSQNGYYFVTICTKDRKNIFYKTKHSSVGVDFISARSIDDVITSRDIWKDSISARLIEKTFIETIDQYECVYCPAYTVMPNHFHCIVVIQNDTEIKREDIESSPTTSVSLPKIIQAFKRYSTLEYIKMVKQNILPTFDKQIWQRGYYEHIIRNEQEYLKIYEYIKNNPLKWEFDRYYNS